MSTDRVLNPRPLTLYFAHYDAYLYTNDDTGKCSYLSVT